MTTTIASDRLREPVAQLTQVLHEGHPPLGILLLLLLRADLSNPRPHLVRQAGPARPACVAVSAWSNPVGSLTGRELVTSPGEAWIVR